MLCLVLALFFFSTFGSLKYVSVIVVVVLPSFASGLAWYNCLRNYHWYTIEFSAYLPYLKGAPFLCRNENTRISLIKEGNIPRRRDSIKPTRTCSQQ